MPPCLQLKQQWLFPWFYQMCIALTLTQSINRPYWLDHVNVDRIPLSNAFSSNFKSRMYSLAFHHVASRFFVSYRLKIMVKISAKKMAPDPDRPQAKKTKSSWKWPKFSTTKSGTAMPRSITFWNGNGTVQKAATRVELILKTCLMAFFSWSSFGLTWRSKGRLPRIPASNSRAPCRQWLLNTYSINFY